MRLDDTLNYDQCYRRPLRCYLLRLSKKLTPSIISFLIFVFIDRPKITHNQL